jgi:phage shock protein A
VSNDPLTEPEASRELADARAALIAARLDIAQWRAQARTWEDNAGQAVELANRELRKRQEAYAKLDIISGEFRQLAMILADVAAEYIAPAAERRARHDHVTAVTQRWLASLQRQTAELEAGDSRDIEDTVEPGLADRGAGDPRRSHT